MQNNPMPNDVFGLEEQASENLFDFPDDVLEMKSPTASALPKAEVSTRTFDDETSPFGIENYMNPTTTDEAPVAQLSLLASSHYSQGSPLMDEELFNELFEEHFNDTAMNGSIMDLNGRSINGPEDDPNLHRFAEPEPLLSLLSPSQHPAQLPPLCQSSNMGPVENPMLSLLNVSGPLLTFVAPQQLQANQGHSVHASSAHGFSVSPYPTQNMNTGYQSFPPPERYRAPVADMICTSVPDLDITNVQAVGGFNSLPLLPEILPAPYETMGPATLPPNMGWQGGQHDFSAGVAFLGDEYPQSGPNAMYPSTLSPWDDTMPDIEGNRQGLASFPEGSGTVHPQAWRSPTRTLTTKLGATRPLSHNGNPKPAKGEPKIIAREKPGFDKEKPWIKTNQNKGLNNRPALIDAYKADEIYTPLSEAPKSWDEYSYHPTGEMIWKKYEPREIEHFLRENPRALTIWLQRAPADSSRRYSGAGLSNCRFKNCSSYCGTIPTGWYRVAFDENSQTHPDVDPMHNAGYAHLYCMEKFLDFPKLCHDLNVRVDDRCLELEAGKRNKMTYSENREVQVAHDFIRTCQMTGAAPDGYPRFDMTDRPYKGTLSWLLTVAKLSKDKLDPEAHAMRKQAKGEGMRTQAVHLGDLELFDSHRIRTMVKEPKPKQSERNKSTKRRHDDSEPDTSEKLTQRRSRRGRREDSQSYDSESTETSSDYDRRQKKSTKEARLIVSKPSKKRHCSESSDCNTDTEPEIQYKSIPGSGSDSTTENSSKYQKSRRESKHRGNPRKSRR